MRGVEAFFAIRMPGPRDRLEQQGRRRNSLRQFLQFTGVFPRIQQRLGFVSFLPRHGERHSRIFSETEQLLFALEAVFQPPELRTRWLHEQVQAAAIGQFIRLLAPGRIFHFEFFEGHGGIACFADKRILPPLHPQNQIVAPNLNDPQRDPRKPNETNQMADFTRNKYATTRNGTNWDFWDW